MGPPRRHGRGLATALELACIGGDRHTAGLTLPPVVAARESYMPRSTADNFELQVQVQVQVQVRQR